MIDQSHRQRDPSPDMPATWIRIVQAGLIGVILGLTLHLVVSVLVVQGAGFTKEAAPKSECKKSAPARDALAPSSKAAPRVSSVMQVGTMAL